MKPKLFVGGTNPEGRLFNSDGNSLSELLEKRISLTASLEDLTRQDFYIAFDSDRRELRRIKALGIPKSRRGIVAFEPKASLPWQSQEFMEANFSLCILLGRPSKVLGEHWPQQLKHARSINRGDRSKSFVMFAGNKLSFSNNELYYFRRATVRSGLVKVFGEGWDLRLHQRFARYAKAFFFHLLSARQVPSRTNFDYLITRTKAGPVLDKQTEYENYLYSLVIENSLEYSSEKLLDALRAFTIPIYVGSVDNIPSEIKDLVEFASPELTSVAMAMNRALDRDWEDWVVKVKTLLESEELFELIDEQKVLRRVSDRVFEWFANK